MGKFRKKPVEIEARRVPTYPQPRGRETSIAAYVNECVALAEWCGGRSHMMNDADSGIEDHILIHTPEGDMRALPGDWVIRGVKGEFYPCKPDIFAATYEPVMSGSAPVGHCEHCPDGHTPADGGSQPWGVWVGQERDGDSQPTTIHVARSGGAHVAESDAEWIRQRLNLAGAPRDPQPRPYTARLGRGA
ncbi:hypothetical protein ACFWWC_03650 [Streptomyces sp. NPDC058642]|uniref:hypothetical protein n=1 Tax=Streptomyces sp. NPDC058642 TaxID=3346572 RepID=UPI00365EFE93